MQPGVAKLPHLFQPGRFGRLEIKNRIKYGACCVSNYNTRDGFITEREIARMRVIARTGCGIITNQGAYPDPLGEGKAYFRQLAIFDDKFLPQFERIAADIKAQGAMPIQQILHAGRYGGIDLGYCIQPSDVPQTLPHFRPPKVMTKDEIRDCVRQHADAAQRAIRAGFDGTEVTSFMGYLLANFNSRFTNQRTDEYGGSIANRGRFMRELIDGIKQATPDHPLVVRLNGAELMDRWGGNTEDECFELMQQAVDVGVDMISVTVGWQEAPESSIGRDIPPGYWNYLSARAKKMFPNTLITFGNRLPDPRMADECLRDGVFDYWEVCRPLLADPDLIHKAAEGRLDEVRPCIGSLNCLSRLFRDLPYTCTMNPALGHEVEPEYQVTPAAVKKKVMVIGAGPAGMECAITAARRGHEVTVFDKADRIGGNLYAYAIHDLARPDDLLSVISQYEAVARKLGIEMRLEHRSAREIHAQRAPPVRRLCDRRRRDARPNALRARQGRRADARWAGRRAWSQQDRAARRRHRRRQARVDPCRVAAQTPGGRRDRSRVGQEDRRRRQALVQVASCVLGRGIGHHMPDLELARRSRRRRRQGEEREGRGDLRRGRHRRSGRRRRTGSPAVSRIRVDDRRIAWRG